jgi:hypothetical protein
VTGEVGKTDDGVLVIHRIHARYRLLVARLDGETEKRIDRVMKFHVRRCPMARTIGSCVEISTEIKVVQE